MNKEKEMKNEYYEFQRSKFGGTKESWQQMLEVSNDTKTLTLDEERKMLEQYKKTPTAELRDKIALHNMRLVVFIAGRFAPRCRNQIAMDDLVQEGYFGLIRAIERFEPETGNKFSTYAYWWIQQSIARYIENTKEIIRIPVHASAKFKKIQCENEKRRLNRLAPLTDEEIKDQFEMSDDEVRTYRLVEQRTSVASINTIVSEDHEEVTELEAFIEDPNSDEQYHRIEDEELKNTFDEILNMYLKRFKKESQKIRTEEILRRRLGLNETGTTETLDKIGADYHISRERVRQIESHFIRFLKLPYNKKKLKEFL